MIITKKIAESIIEKNKMFAPNKAKVILIHDDGRVVFAEKFEQGCAFWFADTMRESKLQGIIYKLTLVAKRNDQGDWVTVCDFSSKVDTRPKSRQERILEAQEKLVAARTSPVIKPAVISPSIDLPPVSQKAVEQYAEKRKEEPVKSPVENKEESEFISIRQLCPQERRFSSPNDLFVSFRSNGKIILCKTLREQLQWPNINMMVSRNFKRFAIGEGKDYPVNKSGTYANRHMCDKLSFPNDSGTIRVRLEWDETLNMYVGDIK
ncbi:hypothetical protein PJM37_0109 [Salmonella phage vB_SenM_UTK0004]|nr:hypothetical protein PJM37_0109 [Salmonella phage vB_SenM_UTK0004]